MSPQPPWSATRRHHLLLCQKALWDTPCFLFHHLLFFTFLLAPASRGLEGKPCSWLTCLKPERKSAFLSPSLLSPQFSSCLFFSWGPDGWNTRDQLRGNSTKGPVPPDSDRVKISTATATGSRLPGLFEERWRWGLCNQRDKEIGCELAPFFARDGSRESWSSPEGDSQSSDRSQPCP